MFGQKKPIRKDTMLCGYAMRLCRIAILFNILAHSRNRLATPGLFGGLFMCLPMVYLNNLFCCLLIIFSTTA